MSNRIVSVLKKGIQSGGIYTIDFPALPRGIYLVRLVGSNNSYNSEE